MRQTADGEQVFDPEKK
jgi:hypothetical protein